MRLRLLFLLGLACTQHIEVSATLAGLNVASDEFAVFSHEGAEKVIATCDVVKVTEAECTSRLTAYRAKETRVLALFSAGYNALAAAVILNDKRTLASAITVVMLAHQAYDDLKKGVQ